MTEEQIVNIFSYHSPTPEQAAVYAIINEAFQHTAKVINRYMPPGAGATVAIRKLSEARMQANAAVALQGTF